jgi:DNA-binding MarR family transcriptional regulator
VQRQADQNDGRASLLRLTDSGRQAAAQLAQARTQKFTHLLERIPTEHRGQVLHALDMLTEALRDPRP